jgi:Domain of unknown function (DUF4291)
MSTGGPRLIRAAYTDDTITVYQAYAPQIAGPAVRAGTFTTGFGRDRMTWIKPSFGWMMHRSGWGRKPGQERVLAIEISRGGWEWALSHSCLSHYAPGVYDSPEAWSAAKASSPVRVQWDPDRALTGERLPRRAIQVGLSGLAVKRYVEEWIVSISDVTELAHRVEELPARRSSRRRTRRGHRVRVAGRDRLMQVRTDELDGVASGLGDVMPPGRGGPCQGARFGVVELPAFALLAFMVMPAQGREVTFARYPALVPGLRVVEVAPGGRAGAARRGTSGVAGG